MVMAQMFSLNEDEVDVILKALDEWRGFEVAERLVGRLKSEAGWLSDDL